MLPPANLFTYDGFDLVTETQGETLIARMADELGRELSFSIDERYQTVWNYDTLGRRDGVAWKMGDYANATIFGHIADSDLPAGWDIHPVPSVGDFAQVWSQRGAIAAASPLFSHLKGGYDLRGMVGETANIAAGDLARHRYGHDALGRRTSRADSGAAYPNAAFDAYDYNARSEVVAGRRYYGSDISDTSAPYGGRVFEYDYDPIGNRTAASEQVGGATLTRSYTANALNQYTSIANPDAVGLRGETVSNATVTVNSELVERDQPASDTWPWHFALEADNAVRPDFALAEIAASLPPVGTNAQGVVQTQSGFLYAPPQKETLTYDADGNLTGDGRFTYTWDAENRLVAVEELVCPTNRSLRRVEYAYDHQSRRVARREYTLDNSQWQLEAASAFIYDGWNLVAETIQRQQTTVTNLYVWGLDLSNSRQGAGGIGGLLAAALATNETQAVGATYGYDGNGNVSVVAVGGNSEPFALATSLEYDPFGRSIAQRTTPGHEPLAAANPFRFSTKWFDNTTGLGYWGYRWYSPSIGRWLNRDPMGEKGGVNLIAASKNNLVNHADILGLNIYSPPVIMPITPGNPSWPGYPVYTPGNPILPILPPPPPPPPPTTSDCVCPSGSSVGKRQKTGHPPGTGTDQECTLASDGIFLTACQLHDNCYSTCNNSKSYCDYNFLENMRSACDAVCGGNFGCLLACSYSAQVYYYAVVLAGDNVAGIVGQSYSQLQKASCEPCCCP